MTQRVVTVYGLASCDSCRKARRWLEQNGVQLHWHDLRKDGVPAARLQHWLDVLGWQQVLNRRSATWRNLDAATRDAVQDAPSALALLLDQPTAIKRPVIEWDGGSPVVTVGLTPESWRQRLQ